MEDLKKIQEFFSKPLNENKVTKEDFDKVVKILSKSKYPFTIMLVPKWDEIDIITGQDSPDEIVDDISQRLDSAGLNWGGNSGITISGDSSNYSRREYSDIFRVNGGHKNYFEESVNEDKKLTYSDFVDMVRADMRAGAASDENASKNQIERVARWKYDDYLKGTSVDDLFEATKEEYNALLDKEYELTKAYNKDKTDANWKKLSDIRKKGKKLEKELEDQAIAEGKSKMPTQDQVDKFFALTQNETHYLNSKPVAGQEATFNLMKIEPWDEYDLSNWNSLVRKAKTLGKLDETYASSFGGFRKELDGETIENELQAKGYETPYTGIWNKILVKKNGERVAMIDTDESSYTKDGKSYKWSGIERFIDHVESLNERDINDPVLMKMRAAKDKLSKMKAANAGGDGNDKFFAKNAKRLSQLKALKDKRAEIMSDMEQEAEPEGGPIADKYGDMLNKIDAAIAKLEGRKEMDYDTAVGKKRDVQDPYANYISQTNAMFGLEEGASTEEKRMAMQAIKRFAKYRGVSEKEAKADLLRAIKELGSIEEAINEIVETIQAGKVLKEKLCKKGEAYRKRRMAAGEKSSAYLSGRAVKVCKGQMSGKKKKK